MTRIREEVEIGAPVERVWAVVHEDLKNAPRWSSNLKRATSLGSGPPGKGSRIRYDLELPAWKGSLEVEQTTFIRFKKCAGKFTDGPLKGTWAYTYTKLAGATRLVYEMDYELGGLLRFAGGVLRGAYADGIRSSLAALKVYVESGKGPKSRTR